VVVLNVESQHNALSDYVIKKLEDNAVNDRNFIVVDRIQQNLIATEQRFQTSGNVADDQAVSIGKQFGAQTIISGQVSSIGDNYLLSIRALNVETAHVQGLFTKNIPPSPTLTALTKATSTTTPTTITDTTSRTQNIQISSSPSDASVYVYDKENNTIFYGKTPATVNLTTNLQTNYLVVINKQGYVQYQQNIVKRNNIYEPNRISANLQRVPTSITPPSTNQTTQIRPPTKATNTDRLLYYHLFGGATAAWMDNSDETVQNYNGTLGGIGGISVFMKIIKDMNFLKDIEIETGVMFTQRGYEYDYDYYDYSYGPVYGTETKHWLYTDYFIKINYLLFDWSSLNDDVKWACFYPYFGVADSNTKDGLLKKDTTLLMGVEFKYFFSNVGVSCLFGFDIGTKPSESSYNSGGYMYNNNDDAGYKNRTFRMSFGVIW